MRSVTLPRVGTSLMAILFCIAPLQHLAANQAASVTAAPADSPDKRCTLSGRVTNAVTGGALRKVSLKLLPAGTGTLWTSAADPPPGVMNSQEGYTATSDNEGAFQFEDIEPGRYNLSGTRFGFLPTRYTGASAAKAPAVVTLVAGQHMANLAVPLTPQAIVSGKVADEDGDPVVGSMVQVTAQKWSGGKLRYVPRTTCAADDLGDFRCANIPPGKYYVSAQAQMDFQDAPGSLPAAKPRARPIKTYYPGSPSLSNATPVEITAGQDVPGVNIRMLSSQTFHVRGRLEGNHTSAYVILSDREEAGQVFMGARPTEVRPDGTFDISGVTPGAYIAGIMLLTKGGIDSSAHQNVDVSTADVNNVVIANVNPGSLKGQISVEGTPSNEARLDFSNAQLSLQPSGGSHLQGPVPSSTVNGDGSFLLSKIPPDRYTVSASPLPGAYVKSIQYGQTEVLGSELDLSDGAAGELRVIYRYGAAEIDGRPKQPTEASSLSTLTEQKIMLVPETLNADGSGLHFSRTDGEGKFKLENLSPGHYRLFAFEQVDFEEIQNPELLKLIADKGVAIELKEGEKRQVEPPLISISDLNQILTRSGIAQ